MQYKEALVVHRKAGDAKGDPLIFQIRDDVGNVVPIPAEREARIFFTLDPGNVDFWNWHKLQTGNCKIAADMYFEAGDKEAGKVRYKLTEADLDTPGRYIGFIRTFIIDLEDAQNNMTETFPHDGYIVLIIERDIAE